MLVYAVIDDSLSPAFPLGDSLEIYVRREDAERFIEEVRADEPELAKHLRIVERELEAGAGAGASMTVTWPTTCGCGRLGAGSTRIF